MSACRVRSSKCSGTDLRLVKLYLRADPRMACGACREVLTATGASFALVEAEPWQPTWRMTARVLDHGAIR